jgi:hypothetical protein
LSQGAQNATILQLFLDGVNCAGDDVIAEVIQRFLFDKIMKAVIGSAGGVTASFFKRQYNIYVDNNSGIIRSLSSIAVKVLLRLSEATGSVDVALAETAEDKTYFLNLRKQNIEGNAEDKWIDNLKITLTKQDRDDLCKGIGGVLLPVLERMGNEIAAFDCDLVVISGKLTSIPSVYDFITKSVHLPSWAFINMNNMDGDFVDVKYATVLGGAQAALHSMGVANAPCHINFAIGMDLASGYDWGITTNPSVPNLIISAAMGTALKQNNGCITFLYENKTIYLLRQRSGGWGTVSISHMITKRDQHTLVNGSVFVTMKVSGGRVYIIHVTGGYRVQDFECRFYGFSGGKHWMDHGHIQ